MKKRAWLFVCLLMISLIGLVGVSETQAAICYNCSSSSHLGCTNWQYVKIDGSSHKVMCCCGTYVQSASESHSMVRVGEGTICKKCSKCGYTTSHTYGAWRDYSDTQHDKVCSGCGLYANRADHYDNNDDGKCDACGHIMTSTVEFNITLDEKTFEYDGTAKEPTVTVKVETTTLVEGTNYDVKYEDNVDAGKATVTITGIGKYAGSSGTENFTITKRAIKITANSLEKVYDGTALTDSTYTISGALAPNQTLSVTTSGSITNVGSTANKITSYSIIFGTEDVTKNYSVTTASGTLIVTAAEINMTVKITGTNTYGQTLTASVTTVPTGCTLTYNWYYASTSSATSGTSIGTGSTVTLNDTAYIGKYIFVKVTASKANYKDVTKTDVTDTENNGSATVVDASLAITTQPTNVAVKERVAASFSVAATGTNLTYQWYKASSSTGAGTVITGATSATYNITAANMLRSLNGTYYYCIVTNSAGSVASNRALLTVYYAPSVKTQPTNQSVNVGTKATFSVVANNGNPSTTYTWQYRTSSTGTWSNCTATQGTGYNSANFTTVAATIGMNGYQYKCVIGNAEYTSAETSNEVTLTVTASVTVELPSIESVRINNGATTTKNLEVIMEVKATNVSEIYVSNTSDTPDANEVGWISYKLYTKHKLTWTNGDKTVYVWCKDEYGNMTTATTASITLNMSYSISLKNNQKYLGRLESFSKYAIKSNSNDWRWQDSNVFTDLTPTTVYIFKTQLYDTLGITGDSEEVKLRAVYDEYGKLYIEYQN